MNNKIMVVDDELPIRKLLDRAFSKKGFDIVTAESGEIRDFHIIEVFLQNIDS